MQYDPRSPKEIESFDLDDGDGKGLYHWEGSSYLKNKKDFEEGLKSGKYRWLKGKKNPDYKFYLNTHEGIPKGTVIKGISSVIRSKKGKYSTRKPEELLELLINSFSNPGDIVLDLFCGSGTACVAAKRLARNYIGCDTNPKAIKIARRRLETV
jgi:site-specific DNA-methyltransferase (adenine-specific)